jgi:Glycosyl transferase family 2
VKLSIIIPNYNYATYLADAIDSALSIEWPEKEIIVVDDGSTDGSRDVMLSYGSRITALFKSNGGQSSACNAGFARSEGHIIIFLDADDVLYPSVGPTLRRAWSDRISKLQWSLALTDEKLKPLGRSFPIYWGEPTPEWIKRRLLRTGHYPFSMNGAFARRFLSQVFPLPTRDGPHRGGPNGDYRMPIYDHFLSMLAPFFGDVVCLDPQDPQSGYRLHGNNNYASAADKFDHYAEMSLEPFECARRVSEILRERSLLDKPINVEGEESIMKRQLICQRFKLLPRHCASLPEALYKYWRSIVLSDFPPAYKVRWFVWSLIAAAAPRPVVLWATGRRHQGP